VKSRKCHTAVLSQFVKSREKQEIGRKKRREKENPGLVRGMNQPGVGVETEAGPE
jgi:hypothetical protein